MMPNVVRGSRMTGLMSYLVGPGYANEHVEPHLVAGDDAMMAWHGADELGRDSGLAIARHLDRPHVVYGVDVKGGHVWHCSLSLRAEEGQLGDEVWGQVARDFVAAMEFDDHEGSKAPCRWVAVHHGDSKNGNDHIHIVVNLVREDGTKASTHHDFRRAQLAARALEIKHGLEVLESSLGRSATRGYDLKQGQMRARNMARGKYERDRVVSGDQRPAWGELSKDQREVLIAQELSADQAAHRLRVRVRGCASASADEAEFVRRLRRSGLIVRPRYAEGRRDVVVGYSVAERPEFGERPTWYGGFRLGRDLSLPRLRERWPDTPVGASAAVAEWNAAFGGRRVVSPGRETVVFDDRDWDETNERLRDVVERLRGVDLDDHQTWVQVARETSGVLAAWSNAVESEPGDLAFAADVISRSAQTYRSVQGPVRPVFVDVSGVSQAALLCAAGAGGRRGRNAAQVLLVRQMLRLAQAVYQAEVTAGRVRHAQLIAEDVRGRLVQVRERLSSVGVVDRSSGGEVSGVESEVEQVFDPEIQAVIDRMRESQAYDARRAVSPVPGKLSGPSRDRRYESVSVKPDQGIGI